MDKVVAAVISVLSEIKEAVQHESMTRESMVSYLDHMLDRLGDIEKDVKQSIRKD